MEKILKYLAKRRFNWVDLIFISLASGSNNAWALFAYLIIGATISLMLEDKFGDKSYK